MLRFLNQPKGMVVLGFTEVFERLSYYTLTALLVLYASAPVAQGGLGWSNEESLLLMGKYTLAAFTMPLIGGYIADRFFGAFHAAVIGGVMITMGHVVMYFSNYGLSYFYMALVLVVCGTALFKPSMPSLLGRLYSPTDERRSGGFNLYYMGINIGGMLAGFSAGILLQRYGYQVALGSAGIGMALGLTTFLLGRKHLVRYHSKNFIEAVSNKLEAISAAHKKALYYLLFSFVFYAIWAIVYNIVNSGTLTLYIEQFTNKTVFGYDIPTTFFSSLEPIGIVLFAPIINGVLSYFVSKKQPIHFFSQMKFALILTFVGIAFFTYLTKITQIVPMGTKPFGYLSISLFILITSLSELLISPVMMSAISVLSPQKYSTSFQALYLSVIGIMGLVAGKIGAISISRPYETFYTLSVVTLIGVVLFIVVNKIMIRAALNAAHELEKHKAQ